MARIGIDARLWNETGVGRYIRNLVAELAAIDHKNQYILFFRKPEFDTVAMPGKNFEKRLADIRWHTVKEQFLFPRLLQQERLDLVHFPYFSVPIFYKGPYVVTVHDLILHHFPTGKASTLPPVVYALKYKGYMAVLTEAVKRSKKVITVSQATKQELIKHFPIPKEKVSVTYEGIDTAVVSKKHMNFDNTSPYFLYVGNAYPHKNLERLLLAFDKIRHMAVEPIRLVFVGKEDYFYKRLKRLVSDLKLDSSVVFYEHVSDSNLSMLYQHAIALVVPSLMEGFGLPALEAMMNDCVVVCSNTPALKEICKDAAEYFNPTDVDDMFRVMEGVMYSDAAYLDEKRMLGKRRAKEFSWKHMAKETLTVYESCLGI